MVSLGARVNAKDSRWLTPLHRACAVGSEVKWQNIDYYIIEYAPYIEYAPFVLGLSEVLAILVFMCDKGSLLKVVTAKVVTCYQMIKT